MTGSPVDGAKWYEKIVIYIVLGAVYFPIIGWEKIKKLFKKGK